MSKNERRDAVRIRDVDAFHSIVPYVMPKRTQSEVSMTECFDITRLCAYMKQRNETEEGTNLKLFHAFCTAVARTVYHRPKMNIFISGRRYWQRKEISLAFVVKRTFEDSSEESLMFLTAKPEMTLDDVSRLILGDVKKIRKEGSNDLDKTMDLIGKMPRPLLTFFFWVLSRLEYHGIMPKSLTSGDPNYSSVFLSNLGSIGCGAPYHHLSNYGTNSIMVTLGTMHKAAVVEPDGVERLHDVVDATFTLDERIADGFYFAKSLRIVHYLLGDPEKLMEPIAAPLPEDLCK